jgi:ADP-heptose:LPS heptosyltransferase
MAAAFGLPTVVVFGASDPAIWGPWRTPHETVTAPGGISPGGITQIQPQQVLEALQRLRVNA